MKTAHCNPPVEPSRISESGKKQRGLTPRSLDSYAIQGQSGGAGTATAPVDAQNFFDTPNWMRRPKVKPLAYPGCELAI